MKIEIAVSMYDIKRVAKSYYYNSLISVLKENGLTATRKNVIKLTGLQFGVDLPIFLKDMGDLDLYLISKNICDNTALFICKTYEIDIADLFYNTKDHAFLFTPKKWKTWANVQYKAFEYALKMLPIE